MKKMSHGATGCHKDFQWIWPLNNAERVIILRRLIPAKWTVLDSFQWTDSGINSPTTGWLTPSFRPDLPNPKIHLSAYLPFPKLGHRPPMGRALTTAGFHNQHQLFTFIKKGNGVGEGNLCIRFIIHSYKSKFFVRQCCICICNPIHSAVRHQETTL
jgi:hypothetical protein